MASRIVCRRVPTLVATLTVRALLTLHALKSTENFDPPLRITPIARRSGKALLRSESEPSVDVGVENSRTMSEIGVAEMRRMLGLPEKSCTQLVVEALERNVSDLEYQRQCQRHRISPEACAYAKKETSDIKRKAVAALHRLERVATLCLRLGEFAQALFERRDRRVDSPEAWHATLDTTSIPKARLQRPSAQCLSRHESKGHYERLSSCADVVKRFGGRYFSYSTSKECVLQHTTSRDCIEGFVESKFVDFYSVEDLQRPTSCARPADFCVGDGASYEIRDCDGDGIPDPYCYGPEVGVSGFLSSRSGCSDTTPMGRCMERYLRSADGFCLEAVDATVRAVQCSAGDFLQDEMAFNRLWHFSGPFLRNGNKCLKVETDGTSLSMANCEEVDSMRWYFDDHRRLRNRALVDQCFARNNAVSKESGVHLVACDASTASTMSLQPIANCTMGQWSEWGACSASCSNGITFRYRAIIQQPDPGGVQCNKTLNESRFCQAASQCPTHCLWGSWQDWSTCGQTCGFNRGVKTRSRAITSNATFGGLPCTGDAYQYLQCDAIDCPVDCAWGDWGAFETCDVPCGGGTRKRIRKVDQQAEAGGTLCDSKFSEVEQCNLQPCPVNCRWSPWGEWRQCSRSCGGATTTRHRTVLVRASEGGLPCTGGLIDFMPCAQRKCPQDCIWQQWQDWSVCSASCGYHSNVATRQRNGTHPLYGGLPCSGNNVQQKFCNDRHCPVDCIFGMWSEWTDCFHAYLDGNWSCYKGRRRSLLVEEEYGGLPCGGRDDQLQLCPVCDRTLRGKTLSSQRLEDASRNGSRQEQVKFAAIVTIALLAGLILILLPLRLARKRKKEEVVTRIENVEDGESRREEATSEVDEATKKDASAEAINASADGNLETGAEAEVEESDSQRCCREGDSNKDKS